MEIPAQEFYVLSFFSLSSFSHPHVIPVKSVIKDLFTPSIKMFWLIESQVDEEETYLLHLF